MRYKSIFVFFIFASRFLPAAEITPSVAVYSSPTEMGEAVARKIADLILERQKEGKRVVLGLATGSTPIPVYRALKKIAREYSLDLSKVVTFNLDEYVGLPASHPQSYRSFMFSNLFDDLVASPENPYGIQLENIHIPDGDVVEEQLGTAEKRALEYEALLEKAGPIDLQLLGIGRNGHIGFAEPGTPFSTRTMVIELSEMTRRDNARFFNGKIDAVPKKAITMGIQTILQAKEIVLLATGEEKAPIIAATLQEDISMQIPSTALRLHNNVSVFLDQKAASRLSYISE